MQWRILKRTMQESIEVMEKYNTGRDRFLKIEPLLLRLIAPRLQLSRTGGKSMGERGWISPAMR